MRILTTVFLIFSFSTAFSQLPGKKTNEPFPIFNGDLIIHVGDTLYLGKGTDPSAGNFKYIYAMGVTWYDLYGVGDPQGRLDNSYNDTRVVIRNFRVQDHRKTGYKKYTQLDIGGMENTYTVDLEDAITSGEIVAVNSLDVTKYQPQVEANQPVIINQGSSLADEILKLKTLRDEGILTEEEFEKAKALLINGGGK